MRLLASAYATGQRFTRRATRSADRADSDSRRHLRQQQREDRIIEHRVHLPLQHRLGEPNTLGPAQRRLHRRHHLQPLHRW